MKILLTGGLGYIGSHTAIEVINSGHEPIIVDNLSNSKIETLDKIKKLTGKYPKFYQEDVCDKIALTKIFEENPNIFAVIHFAGYKSVGESCKNPLKYYYNNLLSTINLLSVMKKFSCNNLILSEAELASKGEADGHTHYVMHTIYCVFCV